jgi:hypothetical protein
MREDSNMKGLSMIYVAVLALLMFSACDVLDQKPQQSLASDDVLTSEKGANSTLAGAYDAYQAVIEDDYIFTELAGEYAVHSGSFPSWASVDQHNLLTTNAEARDLWIEYYALINIANQLIAKVPNISADGFTDAEKNGIVAEAKILRALSYHTLVRFFGRVPLETAPTDAITEDNFKPRAAVADVYDLIVQDLTDAETALGATGAPSSRTATGFTAKALLARVYLYLGDYTNAFNYADEVITTGPFALGTDFSTNFGDTPTSNEVIFRLEFTTEDSNNMSFFALPNGFGGRREYAPDPGYPGIFEANDTRLTTDVAVVGGSLIFNKYNTVEGRDDIPIIRLAEMYLIRAEAGISTGEDESDILADIDVIRNRAGLADIPDTPAVDDYTDQELLDFIMQERAVELVTEGHRWHDLNRLGLSTGLFGISQNMTLWPIPQRDIDSNPAIADDQNPGY